jgi:hypothetical protein
MLGGIMYKPLNLKRERKQAKVEKLEAEVKHLHKLLGTLMHLHERLKNERTQTPTIAQLPTLPPAIVPNVEPVAGAYSTVPEGEVANAGDGKDTKGA